MENNKPSNEIIIYQSADGTPGIEVRVENETVWLSQAQLAELFNTSRPNITMHIKNIFDEGELSEISVCKDFLHTVADGKNYNTKSYNLVSAYFDLAEINAIEQKPMKMADYIRELDNILQSTGRKLLSDAGKISHEKVTEKATLEYRKYKAKNLSEVEKDYLDSLKELQKKAEKKVKSSNPKTKKHD